MSFAITVRGLNQGEKTWLKAEAKESGISMEEFMRRMIRRQREESARRESVSDIFRRYFGPEHGVELPPRQHYTSRPIEFPEDEYPADTEPGR